jgi:hypothetical protein
MKFPKNNLLSALAAMLVFLCGPFSVSAQKRALKPFEPGEQLIYKAEISRSLLKKLDVATFKFSTDRDSKAGAASASAIIPERDSLKFIGDVASEGFFPKLFNINFHEHVESMVDSESLTVQRTIKLDEQGKRVRTSEANFDQQNGKVVWTEKDPNDPSWQPRTATADFSGQINDVLSAIYYLRTQQLDLGRNFAVTISDSGRVYQVPVRVVEKRRVKTVLGRVLAVRIDPELFGEQGLVNAKGQFSVWLTDDYRHIPVSARLKGDFGTFDITLKRVSQHGSQMALAKE